MPNDKQQQINNDLVSLAVPMIMNNYRVQIGFIEDQKYFFVEENDMILDFEKRHDTKFKRMIGCHLGKEIKNPEWQDTAQALLIPII